MLHKVDPSPHAARLLEVVEMQTQLMAALCALPPSSSVDQPWLATVWPQVTDAEWLARFWTNDKGNRATWCNEIAASAFAEKQTLLALLTEQLRFKELYDDPPKVRLTRYAWKTPPFSSAKALLNAFYAPLFYKTDDAKGGYPTPGGANFHKDDFIGKPPKVCPYTDNYTDGTKLDHFLPKDEFPMLSMHPENLIPCSTDPNSVGRKGKRVPLDLDEADQAAQWYHPRIRAAGNVKQGDATYRVHFKDVQTSSPQVELVANAALDQERLNNLHDLFGTTALWQEKMVGEFEDIEGWIVNELFEDGEMPDESRIIAKLKRAARQELPRIGRHGLSICKHALFQHIATDPNLLRSVRELYFRGT